MAEATAYMNMFLEKKINYVSSPLITPCTIVQMCITYLYSAMNAEDTLQHKRKELPPKGL